MRGVVDAAHAAPAAGEPPAPTHVGSAASGMGPWEPMMSSEALETMSQFGAAGSETTSDIGRRIDNITQALQALGHTDEEIMLAVRIEYRKAELSDSRQEEVRLENSIEGIKEWAGREFMELDLPEDIWR